VPGDFVGNCPPVTSGFFGQRRGSAVLARLGSRP
jgi:hypothetical protein